MEELVHFILCTVEVLYDRQVELGGTRSAQVPLLSQCSRPWGHPKQTGLGKAVRGSVLIQQHLLHLLMGCRVVSG